MSPLDASQLDETLDVLTDRYRRYTLYYLSGRTGPVSLDELAHRVAGWQGAGHEPSLDEIETIKTELHHKHLPKLAEAGLVTYGPGSNRVESGETSGIEPVLYAVQRFDGGGLWAPDQ